MFPFPSNGKVRGKQTDRQRQLENNLNRFNSLQTGRDGESKYGKPAGNRECVSIPFKREGTWKGRDTVVRWPCIFYMFQVPSNGKVQGKREYNNNNNRF